MKIKMYLEGRVIKKLFFVYCREEEYEKYGFHLKEIKKHRGYQERYFSGSCGGWVSGYGSSEGSCGGSSAEGSCGDGD